MCQSRGKIHQNIKTEKKVQKVWGYYQLMTSTGSYLSLEAEKMALEAEGWLVKFEQKCKHCGTINSFCRRMSMVKCKKCKKDYRMDDPNHHVIAILAITANPSLVI